MEEGQPNKLNFANDEAEAMARSAKFHVDDPFPGTPPSLLASADVARYIAETGMIYPFDEKRLKTASYEVRPGGQFIYWHKSEGKAQYEETPITSETRSIVLPANSITYLQTEVYFRLPLYIAVRFNLRIKHVHRGLLLGTGPIVDPGFCGRLLIPLHNLTSTEYVLNLQESDGDDGLIWLEFTKTTFSKQAGKIYDFDPKKTDKSPSYYLRAANGGNAILSSIHDGIEEAKHEATKAANSAENSYKVVRNFGIIALFSIVVGVGALVIGSFNVVHGSVTLSTTVRNNVQGMALDLKQAQTDIKDLREELAAEAERNRKLEASLNAISAQRSSTPTAKLPPNK